MNDEVKEREVVQVLEDAKVDVCGLTETKWRGERVKQWEYGVGICAGVGENETAREGVCIAVSKKWEKSIREYGSVSSRIVWVRMKVGIQAWVIVCVYAPTNDRDERVKDEFWENVEVCLDMFKGNERVILIGDMNGKVGDVPVQGVVGQWGVPATTDGNGSSLVDLCAGKGLLIANTFFKHKMIYRYTWRGVRRMNGEMVERKAMIDYMCVDERMRMQVLDARVFRGWGRELSDHHIVIAKVKIKRKWTRRQRYRREETAPMSKVEKLQEMEKREEYRSVVERRLSMYELDEMEGVDRVCKVFAEEVCAACEEVCGVRKRGRGVQGTAWWNDEVKQAVEQKKKAFDEWIASRGRREEREKREVYMRKKREVKRVVRESKRRIDEEFGRNLSMKWRENKKLFWKEVKKVRRRERGSNRGVRDRDNRLIVRKREKIRRWKEHFEGLLNVENENSAHVIGWGIAGRRRERREEDIRRGEVVEALKKVKTGKAPGIDGVCGEMLKYGGGVVVDWLWKVCSLAWEEGKVPEDWKSGIVVPLYKGKGEREVCGNHRGICLLSIVGKIYSRIVIDRVRNITGKLVGEE